MRNSIGLLALVVALGGCASTPKTAYITPQITINGVNAEDARMQLVQRCVTGGGTISENTTHQVVCAKRFDNSFGSIMFQALATPSHSTTPEVKVRYSLVPGSTSTYVTMDMYIEYQTAFGQVNRMPYQNGDVARQGQAMLTEIKQGLEQRTATPQSAGVANATAPFEPVVPDSNSTSVPVPQAPYERDPSKRCDACARLGTP